MISTFVSLLCLVIGFIVGFMGAATAGAGNPRCRSGGVHNWALILDRIRFDNNVRPGDRRKCQICGQVERLEWVYERTEKQR